MSTPVVPTTATPVDEIINDLMGGRRRSHKRRSHKRSHRRSHRHSTLESRMHSMFKGGDADAAPVDVPAAPAAPMPEVSGGAVEAVPEVTGGRKVYTMSNGAKYIKLANGRPRIIKGASSRYMASIRRRR